MVWISPRSAENAIRLLISDQHLFRDSPLPRLPSALCLSLPVALSPLARKMSFHESNEEKYVGNEKHQVESNGDKVVLHGLDASSPDGTVHRNLKSRHLS